MVELQLLKTFSISKISKNLKSTLAELQFLPQDAISFPPGGCLAFWRFYQSSLFCSIRCFKHLKYSIVFVVPIRSFKYISDTPEKCWLNSSLAWCVLVLHTQSNMVCLANKVWHSHWWKVKWGLEQINIVQVKRAVKTSKRQHYLFSILVPHIDAIVASVVVGKMSGRKKMKIITATDILELTW